MDLNAKSQDSFPDTIHNETEEVLQHGIKSKIKGGISKVKNKIKNKIKEIGTGGGGGGGSSNYRYRPRYKNTGGTSYSGSSTALYIAFGIFFGGILIMIVYFIIRERYKSVKRLQ